MLYKLHANTSSKKDVSFAEAMQAVLEDVAGVRSSRGEKKNAPPFGHLDRYSALELRADAQSPTQPTQLQHDVEGLAKWLPSILQHPARRVHRAHCAESGSLMKTLMSARTVPSRGRCKWETHNLGVASPNVAKTKPLQRAMFRTLFPF